MNATATACYGWRIDQDYLCDGDRIQRSEAGVTAPRAIPPACISQLTRGEGTLFRMLDDDGELYYQGRIVGQFEGFEPLDDFGMPNAGATVIEYLKDGQWQPL